MSVDNAAYRHGYVIGANAVEHLFGVTPLQQYMIQFPGGRYQMLGVSWDTRPADEGGQRSVGEDGPPSQKSGIRGVQRGGPLWQGVWGMCPQRENAVGWAGGKKPPLVLR